MIKMIATLVLAAAITPANAADISFDNRGGSILPEIASMEIPGREAFVPENINPFERFEKAKIVGGQEAALGEFPFLVSLRGSWGGHFCGGSLIRKNWVLTAAHCITGGHLRSVKIGLHGKDDTVYVETFTPAATFIHPGWNSTTMNNDFALVQLSGDSKFTPVALNQTEVSGSVDFVTAGWGATSESGSAAKNLMKVTVPFVDQAECSVSYPGKISENMLCAGFKEGGKDSCQGDSGGPLLMGSGDSRLLAGVVSWGIGCARPNKYGVYAKVASGLSWINDTAK